MKKVVVAALLLLASSISYGNTWIEAIDVLPGERLTINTHADWNNQPGYNHIYRRAKVLNRATGRREEIRTLIPETKEAKYEITLGPGYYETDNFNIPWEGKGYFVFTTTSKTYKFQERQGKLYILDKDERQLQQMDARQYSVTVHEGDLEITQ